jgi:ABC-type uncharacterized transport system permease subunit
MEGNVLEGRMGREWRGRKAMWWFIFWMGGDKLERGEWSG